MPEQLNQHSKRVQDMQIRDHHKLGRELGIFIISNEVGQGLPLWLPKGAILRDTLERFLRQEQLDRGYLPVVTPQIGKLELYKKSGHWYKYRDSIFPPMVEPGSNPDVDAPDSEAYILRPMNCPHHIEIYKSEMHSYRDLPLRLAEFATVFRHEQSGELNGVLRARSFTQDDSHMFMMPEQVEDEFARVVELVLFVCRALGLNDFKARLGVRALVSSKYIGSEQAWEQAESAILNAVKKLGLPYTVEQGEAGFYGPKLDFVFPDALGRDWQLATAQVDYNLPERFDLWYIGEDGQRHRPVMIHRACFGSLERIIGTLLEYYAGAFPAWLAPVQVMIIPVSDRHLAYAEGVLNALKAVGIRAEVDRRSERMNAKIRNAQLQKIPYMLVVGDEEEAGNAVAVRLRSKENLGSMPLASFIQQITEIIKTRSGNL